MPTLHIEHPITDLDTWAVAFDRFADARSGAGVTAQRVRRPADDDKYIYVDLDFDSIEAATSFKDFLESVVWASPDNSPGLGGAPTARLLVEVDTHHR